MSVFQAPDKRYNNAVSPVGDIISEVGRGVAEAQQQLDAAALNSFKALYSQPDNVSRELRAIGYLPTWYQIPEASAEINLTMSMGMTRRSGAPPLRQLLATTVDAGVQNQFDFRSELSSKIQFRVVPIPPPVDASDTAVVPELTGLTLHEASERLADLEMPAPQHDARNEDELKKPVLRQSPAPGSLIARDEAVSLFTR